MNTQRNMVRVKDNKDLMRVDGSYIINTSASEYEAALRRRKKMKEVLNMSDQVEELKTLKDELSQLVDELRILKAS